MPNYEYKVVPAPTRGAKSRNAKGSEERFAIALEQIMNEMGEDGWEFHRSETLPQQERKSLTQTVTEWRNVLVFRRRRGDDVAAFKPRLLESPRPALPGPGPVVAEPDAPFMSPDTTSTPDAAIAEEENAASEDVLSINSVLRARAEKMSGGNKDMAAE